MKLRLTLVLLLTTLWSAIGLYDPLPVSAADDFCEGTGSLTTSSWFGAPGAVTTTGFAITMDLGGCLSGSFPSMGGSMTGNCGQFEGHGSTSDGHSFVLTAVGGVTLVTGNVRGIMTIVDRPFDFGSCTNGGTDSFIVTVSIRLQFPFCPPGFEVSEQVSFYRPGVFNIAWWACIPTA